MNDETSVLVLGMDELGSAVARRLHLAGHAVAIHQPTPPQTLRRRMAFADAWSDGRCVFDGVEARRAERAKDFLAMLRSGASIPVLWHPFEDVTSRWPWDVIVDARTDAAATPARMRHLADLTIGIGRQYVAGDHCDLVIDTGARDPGAVIRRGPITRREAPEDARFADGRMLHAPERGIFRPLRRLGDRVLAGDLLGAIDEEIVTTPVAGCVRGLARDGAALAKGADVAEIAISPDGEVGGSCLRDQLIARSVAFEIEMEREGHAPISLESFLG